jgi:hypothetical protein
VILFKITAWIGLSVCNKQYEFYFDEQNQLFFIYEQENDFPEDGSGGLNYNRTELAFEGRYYLNNGKLIDIKTKGIKRIGSKPDAAFIKSLIDDSRSYSKLIIARINKK